MEIAEFTETSYMVKISVKNRWLIWSLTPRHGHMHVPVSEASSFMYVHTSLIVLITIFFSNIALYVFD